MITKEQAYDDALFLAEDDLGDPDVVEAYKRLQAYIHLTQPEGYVLVPNNLTNEMVRAFALATVGRWDSTTDAERQEVHEKLQIAFDEMLEAAPKPGADDD